jgi:hypothetical protein
MPGVWNNVNPPRKKKKKSARITYVFQNLPWIMRGLQERIPRIKGDRTVVRISATDRHISVDML